MPRGEVRGGGRGREQHYLIFSDNSFNLELPNMLPYHVQFAANYRPEYNIYTGSDPLKLAK